MKILTILGARPQFIKAGTVSRVINELKSSGGDIEEIIVHTGQHYDSNMSDIFFNELDIPKPHYNLGVGGLAHGAMTGQMLEKIESIIISENPDWLLVYGDTNSTLAGSIAASKLHVKVAHVEAGLRSYNKKMPEEINRILTDNVSSLLFCPTPVSLNNLVKEGFESSMMHLSGDVMYDGAIYYKDKSIKPIDMSNIIDYVLVTVHRAENTDDFANLKGIVDAINVISQKKQVVIPLHPRTKSKISSYNLSFSESVTVIDPVGYLEMIWLIKNSFMIITDSGGLQKESYFFEKNCIVLRLETEWSELVDLNYNVLSGSNSEFIVDNYINFKFNTDFSSSLYGKGDASRQIVEHMIKYNPHSS